MIDWCLNVFRRVAKAAGRKAPRRSGASPDLLDEFESRLLPPRLLGPRLTGLKLLLLGTCQVEHLLGSADRFGFAVDHILFDALTFSEIPEVAPNRYDGVVVGLTVRSILNAAAGWPGDVFYLKEEWSEDKADAALEVAAGLMGRALESVRAKLPATPLFVMSFLEPSANHSGHLIPAGGPSDIRRLVRRLNDRLADIVARTPQAWLFDMNDAMNFVGRMHLHDDLVSHTTHASIIGGYDDEYDQERLVAPVSNLAVYRVDEHLKLLHSYFYNRIADNLKIIRQIDAVKIIIVDLDDTMWRGVAADSEMEDWRRVEGWPLGFHEALAHFRRRGGLLAICSKNEEEPTRKRFADIVGGRLGWDDFVSAKINWKPKSENIAEILAEANLLPESALFIDDNPREISEVKARFPTLRCLGGRHQDWRRIILGSPETQVAEITRESQDRTQLVRAKIERETQAASLSRDEWLASLEIEQHFDLVRTLDHPAWGRTLELINKTNQFNTTGRRWRADELEALFREGGACVIAGLKDKTVDNGIIGVAIVRPGEIVQTVLSCRVFGLGAELALGGLAAAVALEGQARVRGQIVDTGKNKTCHDYFERLGFTADAEGWAAEHPAPPPAWIRLSLSDPLARYAGWGAPARAAVA